MPGSDAAGMGTMVWYAGVARQDTIFGAQLYGMYIWRRAGQDFAETGGIFMRSSNATQDAVLEEMCNGRGAV